MMKILLFVFIMRCLLFVASFANIPIEIVAVLGSAALLLWRWYHLRTNPVDILEEDPLAYSNFCILNVCHYIWLA